MASMAELLIPSMVFPVFTRSLLKKESANRGISSVLSLKGGKLIGHNNFFFDMPFIVHRSWVCDVPVPDQLRTKYRTWNQILRDTMEEWKLGVYNARIKLDVLGYILGEGRKPEGVDGAMFAGLWRGTTEERQTAIDYLVNDVVLTWRCAVRLGVAP